MYRLVSKLYPKKLRSAFEQVLMYNNIATNPDRYVGMIISISFMLSILISALIRIFVEFNYALLLMFCFFVIQGSVYAYLVLSADKRATFVENILPDALQLMSANLRAGMTVDKALLLAARPEFGQFKEDINQVGKEIATGKEFNDALLDLSKKIRSEKLKKTFQLIVTGVEAGGELSELLEHSASNLRQQKLVEERVRSSVLVYVIFIFSAISFGAPMLFGLSSFLVEVITDIFSKIELPRGDVGINLPMTFSKIHITPKFVNTYTLTSLMMTSVMGSLILGLISKGREKEGLKYLPILVIMTITLFFTVKFLIKMLLGGLFNI